MNGRWPHSRARLAVAGLLVGSLVGFLAAQVRVGAAEPPASPVSPAPPASQPAMPVSDSPAQTGDHEPIRAQLVSGLVGSKHDFRRLNAEVRDLCLPCHTPHLAIAPVPRLDQRSATTQPLRPYARFDIELSGWSLLCLGCHDGVTAPDVYTFTHAVTLADPLNPSRLGTRGLRSHPVGVKYPGPREDYNPLAGVEASGLTLPDGRIQCTTCHDAHNTHGFDGFLRVSNRRSALCLTCHRL